jgi:hypothetical protein
VSLQKIFAIRPVLLLTLCVLVTGCGGLYEYRVQNMASLPWDKKFPGDVSLSVATEPVYNHAWGFYEYKLHVRDGVEKEFQHLLNQCFEGGCKAEGGNIHIVVTALDTSTFPIGSLLIDIRLFFRVEIFYQPSNAPKRKQKTVMVYGFGSDSTGNGNHALEKAIANSFYQLLPTMEEMFGQ